MERVLEEDGGEVQFDGLYELGNQQNENGVFGTDDIGFDLSL
uniref:Uncharacterized protein n=1 Tax=Rhizophora mucronata TaxID=61149 RepID=A0A2P2PQ50_RHIMU